jgi:hypothetical protein
MSKAVSETPRALIEEIERLSLERNKAAHQHQLKADEIASIRERLSEPGVGDGERKSALAKIRHLKGESAELWHQIENLDARIMSARLRYQVAMAENHEVIVDARPW